MSRASIKPANAVVHPEADWPAPASYTYPDANNDSVDDWYGKPIFTPEEAAQQLNRGGGGWNVGPDGIITYTFLDKAPSGHYNTKHGEGFGGLGSYTAGFAAFTEAQRAATRDAIDLWDDLIAPSFVEKNGRGAADISYMNTNTGPAQAAAFVPWKDKDDVFSPSYNRFDKLQGDIFVNQGQGDNFDLLPAATAHDPGPRDRPRHRPSASRRLQCRRRTATAIENSAEYFQDTAQFTIMSYFDAGYSGAAATSTGRRPPTSPPQTPMLHDIAAVQTMYGADLTTRTGDTTYGFNSNAGRDVFDFDVNINPFLTIYDAGGHDTLDFSGWTGIRCSTSTTASSAAATARRSTRPSSTRSGRHQPGNPTRRSGKRSSRAAPTFPGFLSDNISIAYGTVIEDGITGSGNDALIGNEVANRLDGGAGQDTYTGGAGNDVFVVGHAGNADFLTDFKSGADKLDLSAFGMDSSDITFSANGKTLFGDVNGDGTADFAVVSQGDAILVSDIIFG